MILYNIQVKHSGISGVAEHSYRSNSAHADGWAIGLSGLCLVHCLALPIVALAAPAALGLERYHLEVHVAFLVIAVGLTIFAFWPGQMHGVDVRRSKRAMALAATGLAFMISAVIGPLHLHERLLTTIGVLILASAHVLNWRVRMRAHKAIHAAA